MCDFGDVLLFLGDSESLKGSDVPYGPLSGFASRLSGGHYLVHQVDMGICDESLWQAFRRRGTFESGAFVWMYRKCSEVLSLGKGFPTWEDGLERGWTFKIVNQSPKNGISFGNIKCSDYFLIQKVF